MNTHIASRSNTQNSQSLNLRAQTVLGLLICLAGLLILLSRW